MFPVVELSDITVAAATSRRLIPLLCTNNNTLGQITVIMFVDNEKGLLSEALSTRCCACRARVKSNIYSRASPAVTGFSKSSNLRPIARCCSAAVTLRSSLVIEVSWCAERESNIAGVFIARYDGFEGKLGLPGGSLLPDN
jgi:hypothetical protein